MDGTQLDFSLVDVFGTGPYSGNPLPVVFDRTGLSRAQMLRITQEFRQFETVFVSPTADATRWRTRVFDLLDELPFAGHPLLGAAAAICARQNLPKGATVELTLAERTVMVEVKSTEEGLIAWLDAGRPTCRELASIEISDLLARFGLVDSDISEGARAAVMNTGLSYVVLPVTSNAMTRARIKDDITEIVVRLGAQFAVLLDPVAREIRHWNNDGLLEDVATGSAASVVSAFLVAQNYVTSGETIKLLQGRFAGRSSELFVRSTTVNGQPAATNIGGRVDIIAAGQLLVTP